MLALVLGIAHGVDVMANLFRRRGLDAHIDAGICEVVVEDVWARQWARLEMVVVVWEDDGQRGNMETLKVLRRDAPEHAKNCRHASLFAKFQPSAVLCPPHLTSLSGFTMTASMGLMLQHE
jgi:hypothetical protein